MKNQKIILSGIVVLVLVGGYFYFTKDVAENSSEEVVNGREVTSEQEVDSADRNTDLPPFSFTAEPISGEAPLSVFLTGRIDVARSFGGNAIVFFGDGTADLMQRSGPEIFEETWTHVYSSPGEYEVLLVLTSISNVDADIEVIRNPNHPSNIILGRSMITVR